MEQANDFFNTLLGQGKNINVAKLGKVVNFKSDVMAVDVIPLPGSDNSIILNVPVATIKSRDYTVYYPLSEGDTVVLLFIDNDTDNILLGEDSVQTERQHDISDCICLGGITLLQDSLDIENFDSLTVKSKETTIEITDELKIKSNNVVIEANNIELKGHGTLNGSRIAVAGDGTSDGATII